MNPEDMPKNVLRWLQKQAPPFLLIATPLPAFGATRVYFDDDPEAVEAISKAYDEVVRKRLRKPAEKK